MAPPVSGKLTAAGKNNIQRLIKLTQPIRSERRSVARRDFGDVVTHTSKGWF